MTTNLRGATDPALSRHTGPIVQIRTHPAGWVATAGTDSQVCVTLGGQQRWHFDVGARMLAFQSTDRIRDMAFSPDGRRLFVSGAERLNAFDLDSGQEVWNYLAPNVLAFLHNPSLGIAATDDGGVVSAFDAGTLARFGSVGDIRFDVSDNDAPHWVAWRRGASQLLGADGFRITLWDGETGAKLSAFDPGERIFGFAYDHVSDRLAVRAYGSVDVWDAETMERVVRFPQSPGLPALAWTPNGAWIAAGEDDGFTLWSADGHHRERLAFEGRRLTSICFGDDDQVYVGDAHGGLHEWRLN